jgi:UDP-N-acetylglucosamine/UDP-N-acetylgalactosamine diphosphorylase
VKNAPGAKTDSPETEKAAMAALHREWLTAAGAKIADNVTVEISPSYALDADEVARKIIPGQQFNENTYLSGS